MASIDRNWETSGVAIEVGPPRDAVVQRESAVVRPRAARDSQLNQIFNYVLMLYLFAYVGRIPEMVSFFRIGLLLEPILLIGLVLTKNTRVLLKILPGRWLIAFTIWVAIGVPFSFWPGGSFGAFVLTARALLLIAYILAYVRSIRDVTRALTTIGFASGMIAVVSFLSPDRAGGRQGMASSASLGDANFFALYLLVGLPALCFTASQLRGWVRICSLALIPINLAGIARSGSRAGLITLGLGTIMVLVYGSAKQRTVIVSAALVGVLLAFFFLPDSIRQRFTDLMAPTGFQALLIGHRTTVYDKRADTTAAEGSTEARLYLLRRSLILTAKHPLLGVGADQFQGAEAEDAAANGGERGAWHYTHNTYTQMSSEVGIPGLILFAGALFGSYRGLSGIRKRGPTRYIREMALFLQTSYFMLMVGAFFLTLGYGGLPFVLIGISEAFKLAVRRYVGDSSTSILPQEMSVAA